MCMNTYIQRNILGYINKDGYVYRYRLGSIITINGKHVGERGLASVEHELCTKPFNVFSHLNVTIAVKCGYYYLHICQGGKFMNFI